MNIEHATDANLQQVSRWITTAVDCQIWAGPQITFPIKHSLLAMEIMFCEDNSYCLRLAGEIAGFGQLIHINDACYHLARIITHPQCRGKGVARRLCSQLVNTAWQRGGSQVSLNVYRSNDQAMALYQSLGFCEQAERSDENMLYMLLVKAEQRNESD